MSTESVEVILRATLRGHEAMVTAIAIPSCKDSNVIMSSSRDKTLILWYLSKDTNSYAVLLRRLTGHSNFVSDVALSSDARFAVSASWDGELRLWDLARERMSNCRLIGHTKGVLSVALFADYAIVSASRDRTLKLWNTQGVCLSSTDEVEGHTDWVSCVGFNPENEEDTAVVPTLASCSWDGTIRVWELDKVVGFKKKYTLVRHEGYLNAVVMSPEGSILASGGSDGVVVLWDTSSGENIYEKETGFVHALCFSPSRYWLCIATDESIKIFDLQSKEFEHELKVSPNTHDNNENYVNGGSEINTNNNNHYVNGGSDITTNNNNDYVNGGSDTSNGYVNGGSEINRNNNGYSQKNHCTSLNWSVDGSTLFAGYRDGTIRVWEFI